MQKDSGIYLYAELEITVAQRTTGKNYNKKNNDIGHRLLQCIIGIDSSTHL